MLLEKKIPETPMQIKILKNFNEAEQISEQWNELLSCCSASHVPFLRFEYLSTWWETLGGGEWPDGDLHILVGESEKGELVGIAPLFYTKNRQNEPALMLIGSIEISDYLDFIVRTPDIEEFAETLLNFLDKISDPPWRVLDLYNLPDTSPTLPALMNAAKSMGWIYDQEQLQPCPYIPLPGDWEAYLSMIDKKQRHEIRRKMRRAEENTPPAVWYFVTEEERLDQEIDDFLAMMAQDPEKARFLSEVMRTQMRASVHAASQAGWLQLAFLTVGDDKTAAYLNFDFGDHIWVYNSGWDLKYRELSPGWVLLGHLLKWANDNGRKSFDFMRGAEDYKYRFGGIERFVMRAHIKKN
jgi:CelD/BcsL family acetyltransferase involved in cellulose biosynthesis